MKGCDTETTGLDVHHGALPFFVTISRPGDIQDYWEWDVNPLNRMPIIPDGDIQEIETRLAYDDPEDGEEGLVLQNPKFDVSMLSKLPGWTMKWPWIKTYDTLFAGHLLASGQPHDLTTMLAVYCGINIKPLEEAIKLAAKEARRIARSDYPDWRIAKKGLVEMPSCKEETWAFDMWLPRRIAQEKNYSDDHPWWTVLSNYSNADSAGTLLLMEAMKDVLISRDLWEIYLIRLKLLPIVTDMEKRGISLNSHRRSEMIDLYREEVEKTDKVCKNIALSRGYELDLPKSGSNKSLSTFVFGGVDDETGLAIKGPLNLKPARTSEKTGNPSLDREVRDYYLETLPERSKEHRFIRGLSERGSRNTAITYMEGYARYWIAVDVDANGAGWYRIHPSLNPTGTNTLRWSSQNPNEQNISKKEGFNLRNIFGPAPGREWWSCDAKNIELRLPAYEAGEEMMIDLFENPDKPPFYGSNHLLNFSIVYPVLWEKYLHEVKKKCPTEYGYVKNGGFAIQYGAVDRADGNGTADRAFHVKGAHAKLKSRLGKITHLTDSMLAHAQKYGYVETMPDKTVNPHRGYPLQCTRTHYGDIKPTIPLSYHVQGTAMWWMMKAMLRCQEQLDDWNSLPDSLGYYMILQVHDELVFDFPKGIGLEPWKTNKPRMKKLMYLMSRGGDDIGVPTPVSCEYHDTSWSVGLSV